MSRHEDEDLATAREDFEMEESDDEQYFSAQDTPSPLAFATIASPRPPTHTRPSADSTFSSPASSTTSFHSYEASSSGLTNVISSVELRPTPTPVPTYSNIPESSPAPPYSSHPLGGFTPPSSLPRMPRSDAGPSLQATQTPMLSPLPQPFQDRNSLGLNVVSRANDSPSSDTEDNEATPRGTYLDGFRRRRRPNDGVGNDTDSDLRSVRRYVEVNESITLREQATRLHATVLALQGELITKNQDLLAAQSNVNHLQADLSDLRLKFEQVLTGRSQERERMTLLEKQIHDEQHNLAATLEAQRRTFHDAERRIEEERTKWEAELERRKTELDERTSRQEASLNTRSAEYNEHMKKLEQESALLAKERDLVEKTRNEIEAERLKMFARLREKDLSQQLSVSTTPRSKSSDPVPGPSLALSSSPAPPPAPPIGPVHAPAHAPSLSPSSSPAPLSPALGPIHAHTHAHPAHAPAHPAHAHPAHAHPAHAHPAHAPASDVPSKTHYPLQSESVAARRIESRRDEFSPPRQPSSNPSNALSGSGRYGSQKVITSSSRHPRFSGSLSGTMHSVVAYDSDNELDDPTGYAGRSNSGGQRRRDSSIYSESMLVDHASSMPGSFLAPSELREARRHVVFRWEPPNVQRSAEATSSWLDRAPYRMDPDADASDNDGSVANFAHAIPRPPRNDDEDEEEVSSILHASDADDSMDDDDPAPPPRLRKGKHVHVNSGGSRPPPRAHSASSIIHDDDADVPMHDDEATPLARMYKAGNAHVSVDGGKPRKRKNLPEKIDVNVPTPTQRLQYMAILRELFRTEYNLTSDMDWYRFIPATKDEMDEYEREQGLGPCSVTHAYIDPGWRTCRWNKTIFGFVLQDFISQCTSRGMSTDDEGYLYALIVDKCDRGFQTWRRMRPKPGEDTPKNIERNAREYTEGLEKARTQANRRNKHGRRITITDRCAQQNTPGPLQGKLRTAVATYLQVGGDACMSSEDDCIDRLGTRVRRKKILPWRRKEVDYAMLATDSMRSRPGVFSNRGAVPTMSIQGFKTSDRSPPRGLPISFYDPQWYDALSEYQKEVLGTIPGGRYDWIFETFRRSRR